VIWQHGGASALGALLGEDFGSAYAINDLGQAVGHSVILGTGTRAVLWQGGNAIELDSGGASVAVAYAINNAGNIVGFAQGGATLWQNGGAERFVLQAQIDPTDPLFGLVTFREARGINESGQIIVNGSIGLGGAGRAFLLTPVPEPRLYVTLLTGVALVGLVARHRRPKASSALC
jgi:uncharacterized membrane protein